MEVQINAPIDPNGAIILNKHDFKQLTEALNKAIPKIEAANKGLGYRDITRLKKEELDAIHELIDAIESGHKAIIDNYG